LPLYDAYMTSSTRPLMIGDMREILLDPVRRSNDARVGTGMKRLGNIDSPHFILVRAERRHFEGYCKTLNGWITVRDL